MRRRRVLAGLGLSVATVAGFVVGVEALVASAPASDADMEVPDVEPLAVEGVPSCERLVGDPGEAEEETEARAEVRFEGRVSSAQVNECPDAFDGVRVTFVGEVVGDVLRRQGGAWTLLNDDDYALEHGPMPAHRQLAGHNSGLSVWLPDSTVETATPGGPGRRGDVLEVRGTVLRADSTDGGGLTLRAEDVDVLTESRALRARFHVPQALAALVAVALATLAALRRRAATRG